MKEQAPDVCFLMETRLDRSGFEKHCGDVPFKNKFIVKKPNSGGRIGLDVEGGSEFRCNKFY